MKGYTVGKDMVRNAVGERILEFREAAGMIVV